ncbi:MAG: BlaI/MecI/CopY family transcriptional regulator [Verrucomicrobia bacterium]|nr:BlaI/MecI/CopY family transcriptional regulator [Verrucomicrobiota bacterium]
MKHDSHAHLSRRERQIMDVIYQRGEASAQEVLEALPSPPGYSAVRALLRILEEKGHLKHREDGPKYIFLPTHARENAGLAALQRVVQTFYEGSVSKAVAALVEGKDTRLPEEEVKRLRALVRQTRSEGR